MGNQFSPSFNNEFYAYAIEAAKNKYSKSKNSKELTKKEKETLRKAGHVLEKNELEKPLGRAHIVGSKINGVSVKRKPTGKKTLRFEAKESLTGIRTYDVDEIIVKKVTAQSC